jgi:hypothetical protein
MFCSREQDKILRTVVCLDVIDVMDDFIGRQWSPDGLGYYNAVFRLVSFLGQIVTLKNVLVSLGTECVSATPVGMLPASASVKTPTRFHSAAREVTRTNFSDISTVALAAPKAMSIDRTDAVQCRQGPKPSP